MEINLKNIKGEHDIVIDEYVDFPLVIEKLKDLLERDNNIYKTLNEEGKEVDNNLQVKNQEKAIIETNNNLLKEKEIITKALEELLSKEDEYKNKANIPYSIKENDSFYKDFADLVENKIDIEKLHRE